MRHWRRVGGGGSSSGNTSQNSKTSISITIPAAATSSDINLLGDLQLPDTNNFYYEIWFENKSFKSEHKTAGVSETVTFNDVPYDTYDFYLKIWVDSRMKQEFDTITVNKTVSATENTVQFPNMSVSSYKQWFFVATKEDFIDAIDKIKNDTATYTAEKKAIICLRDGIACPGFQSKLNEIDGRYTLYTNNYEIADVLYTVSIAGGITGGAVSADPTSASVGREITLTITPDAEKELDTLSVSGVTEINYNDARTEATFAMPASNVTVSATFKTKKYAVTLPTDLPSGCSVSLSSDATTFEKGENVELMITVADHYRLNWLKAGSTELVVEDNAASFEMTSGGATVTAEFVQLYAITLPTDAPTGTTFAAKIGEPEVTEAAENDSVTITITPASGYALETLKQGENDVTASVSNNEYEFIMDAESVEFTATWKAEEKTPDTVGDVVLSTGKAVAYANIAKMSSSQKSNVVGIFIGNGLMTELGESPSTVKWYNVSGHAGGDRAGITDMNSGITNRTTLNNTGRDISSYPPFSYAAGKSGSVDWYVPAANELSKICYKQDTINSTVTALTDIEVTATAVNNSVGYWSSTEDDDGPSHYAYCHQGVVMITSMEYTDGSLKVRCIAAIPSE